MSLPYRFTTTSALSRPLLPSNLVHPPSRILLRERHSKSGDLASRLVADNITRSNAWQRQGEEETLAHQQKKTMDYAMKAGMNPLVPTTFVALPMNNLPKSLKGKVKYLWLHLRSYVSTIGLIIATKTDSMAGWNSRPRFKARLTAIPPTAKIMYHDLLEAFAAGDKATVRKVCTPHFASQYTNAIDKRKKSEGLRWELVKYNASPKLKSYLIMPMNPQDRDLLTEQVVVAISSTQRMSKVNNTTGQVIPGSEKEQDGTEYVVMKREYSKSEWAPIGDWQIWGTTEPTTLKKIKNDLDMIEKRQLEIAGWKKSKQ